MMNSYDVKTILLSGAVVFAVTLAAQAADTNPAAPSQAEIQRLLDQAYAELGETNPPAGSPVSPVIAAPPATNPPPAAFPPATTDASGAVTNPLAEPPRFIPPGMTPPGAQPGATSPISPPRMTSPLSPPPGGVVATNPSGQPVTLNPAVPSGVTPPGATPPPGVTAAPVTGTVSGAGTVPGPGGVAAGAIAPGTGAATAVAPGTNAATAIVTNAAGTLSALDDPRALSDDQLLAAGVIKFNEADLLQVLDVYQELTGRTVLRPTTLPATKISIRSQTPLTRREAVQALDSILSLNQIAMTPQGDKFVKAVPANTVFGEAAELSKLDPKLLPESGSYVTHVVQMKNATPSEVVQALTPLAKLPNSIVAIDDSGILLLRDYSENVKRMLELLDKIDVVPIKTIEPIVIPIKYALAGDIAQVLSSLTSGGSSTTIGSSGNAGLTGGGVGGFGAGGLANTPGGANPFNRQGGLNQQQNNALGQNQQRQTGNRGSFQDRLRSIVSRAAQGEIAILGETQIIADERTNSLLIFAARDDIATIKDIIAKLDVVLPQVLIEAIIMEVSLGNETRYGVSYLQKQPSTAGDFTGIGAILNKDVPFLTPEGISSAGTNTITGGLTYFARFGNDFEATLVAVASDSRVNILSRPRIQTSHAVQADLFVGRTRPYVTGTYFGFSGQPQSQFQQQQIGITLSVLPLINPEGLVVMDIRQKVQSIGKDIAIDANFSVPETIDREATAKVSVRDRETVVLGGFISSDINTSKSGVPILKDLPILGNLFRTTEKKNDRGELMIMIRPTVLPTPEIAAEVAVEETSKMPGVLRAQRDYKRDEAERLRQAEEDRAKEREQLYRREGFNR